MQTRLGDKLLQAVGVGGGRGQGGQPRDLPPGWELHREQVDEGVDQELGGRRRVRVRGICGFREAEMIFENRRDEANRGHPVRPQAGKGRKVRQVGGVDGDEDGEAAQAEEPEEEEKENGQRNVVRMHQPLVADARGE